MEPRDLPLADAGKPAFGDEYLAWLREEHEVDVGAEDRTRFEVVSQHLQRAFAVSPFYTQLPGLLRDLNASHKVERGFALLPGPVRLPELNAKSWESFWDKTYRINVLDNTRWPAAPNRGWVLPDTWFTRIGDIVRTRVVVRYLDGMEIVAAALRRLAATNTLTARSDRVAKEEGYYATHLDLSFPVTVPSVLDTERLPTSVEIQIATELQENIYVLAHGSYAASRLAARSDEWRWDYTRSDFAANYLGHVLHYLEGMIMRLRQEQREDRGD